MEGLVILGGTTMKLSIRKNWKISVAIAMVLCLSMISVGVIKSNASVIRQDEWMKKFCFHSSIKMMNRNIF